MKFYTAKSSAHRAAKQAGLTKDQYEIVEIDGQFGYQLIDEVEDYSEGEALEAMEQELYEAQNPDAPEIQAEAPKGKIEITNCSTIERPTKAVWHIADEMSAANPQVRRKDVIAECVRRGIAFYTARTQYQQWLQVKKEMAEREAQQAAGK